MEVNNCIQARNPWRLRALWLLSAATLLTFGSVHAAAASAGYQDFSYPKSIGAPTSDKPQSKLWWNDGSWWGCLYSPMAGAFDIYRFDFPTQTWVDTDVQVDSRSDARMDVLWDGFHLYMASGSLSSDANLLRYSYDPIMRTYSLDPGFPLLLRKGEGQSICIAKDSLGHLWVTFTQNDEAWVRHSTANDTSWSAPYVVPTNGAGDLTSDDTSAIISFQGSKIGVMWSNQTDKKTYFAYHVDTDPDTTWHGSEVVLPPTGGNPSLPWSDNHIDLKALDTDPNGRVFAGLKTSLDATDNSSAPLVMLSVRDANGNWTGYTFGRVADHHTRPQIIVDEEHRILYVFATSPDTPGGTIYYKMTPLDSISFPVGLGTPFIQSSTTAAINNFTSTKQNVNSTTEMVGLACDASTGYYYHNVFNLTGDITLNPSADAYVQDGAEANTNFGGSTSLLVKTCTAPGFNRDSYLNFSTAGIDQPVGSAVLNLHAGLISGTNLPVSIFGVPNPNWSENLITWNNRPSLGSLIATLSITGTNRSWYSVDVTNYLSGLTPMPPVFGIALHSQVNSTGPVIQVDSGEAASNQPTLTVDVDGTAPVPAAPSNLTATLASSTEVDLQWLDNSSNEDGFIIDRSTDGTNFARLAVVGPDVTSYVDMQVTQNVTYYYRVRAYHTSTADSAESNVVSATPSTTQSGAPSKLTAVAASSSEIDLTWQDNTASETGYEVDRSTDGTNFGEIGFLPPNTTSYPDVGLSSSTTYYYRVCAVYQTGSSPFSNIAFATTTAVTTVVKTAVADAYVRDGAYANTNYGSSSTLYVKSNPNPGYNRIAFFAFDLTGLPPHIISANFRFSSALTATPGLSTTLYVVPDSTWKENLITWNNMPALGNTLGSVYVTSLSYSPYQVDVTGYINSQLGSAAGAADFALTNAAAVSNNLVEVASRETSTSKPQLVITY